MLSTNQIDEVLDLMLENERDIIAIATIKRVKNKIHKFNTDTVETAFAINEAKEFDKRRLSFKQAELALKKALNGYEN